MYPKCLFYAVFLGTLSAQPPSFDLTTIPTKNTPQSLIVGDFNRDGRPDLAVSGIDAGGNGTVEILLGNGDGSFRSAGVITVGAHASRIAQADFNSDGKLDLAVSVGDSGQVVVLLGNGDGSFKGPVDSGARVPAGQLGATVPGLAVGDINGDGKPDLVLGPYTFTASCSLAVLLGNGDGTFRSPVNSPMDRVDRPQALVADLNGDGRADVFVTGWSPDKGKQRFGRLLGNGDGSLTLTWSTYTYPFIFGTLITIHDVNGNGKPDVIGIDYLDYPNAGRLPLATFLDGSLEEIFSSVDVPYDSRAGLKYQSMTAADVDGDGHSDLLLSDPYGNLLVMLGGGDGTFHGPPGYPAASPSQTIYTGAMTAPGATYFDAWGSLTTADFRGVGKQDVVMALAGKSVSLLKNSAGASPVVSAAGVANAASLAVVPSVPGSLAAVFGNGFAYASGTTQFGFPLIPYAAASTLFGLTIQASGIDAPLLYASPTQANIQIPWELAGKTQATLLVTRNGTTQTIAIPLAAYAPGLFAMNGEGTGQAAALVVATPTAIAAPAGAFPGSRPIHRGEYLSLYGTGLGEVDRGNAPFTGETANSAFYTTTTKPQVTVGGVTATVQYSGLAPTLLGVYQINILMPDSAPTGSAVPVSLNIGGVPSNVVTIAIQ